VTKPIHPLFPTKDSIEIVEEEAKMNLPIETENQLIALLRTFENTLRACIARGK
jgi:hypothetical protein